MLQRTRHLSPTEAARRLGVSAKALRLYERHGLVKPARSAKGWRAYGPDEIARLHQVLALKSLGLSLARIALLIKRPEGSLAGVLALQEEKLTRDSARVGRALTLVHEARSKLAAGQGLSIDDLVQLTKETTMTREATPEELKAIFDPISKKHFSEDERQALSTRKFDQDEISRQWEQAIADAKVAMAKGDPGSTEAKDVARRWKALIQHFTGGNPEYARKANAVWQEAMADPKAAPKLPLNPEVFAFMQQAVAKLEDK